MAWRPSRPGDDPLVTYKYQGGRRIGYRSVFDGTNMVHTKVSDDPIQARTPLERTNFPLTVPGARPRTAPKRQPTRTPSLTGTGTGTPQTTPTTQPTATPTATTPQPKAPTLSDRLQSLLDSDSPYLERARLRGRQFANRRGLLNSSIAAEAAEAAALDAALPIAQGDVESQERALDRELSKLLQERDNNVRILMQNRGFDFESAQREADRQFQRSITLLQQRFQSTQLDLDRTAARRNALNASIRAIEAEYQRNINLLSQNQAIPVEERRRLEEHYAFLRDSQMRALNGIYGVDLTWESTRQPREAA